MEGVISLKAKLLLIRIVHDREHSGTIYRVKFGSQTTGSMSILFLIISNSRDRKCRSSDHSLLGYNSHAYMRIITGIGNIKDDLNVKVTKSN
jgi:hypothetical protein